MADAASQETVSQGFDDASWLFIGLCFALVVGFQMSAPFAFSMNGIASSAAMIAMLGAANLFYTRYRVRPAFAALLTCVLQIILFSMAGAVLSYMVAAHGGPLWDESFRRWDLSLGLDWLAYARWVNDHPSIGWLYRYAYMTMVPQLLVLVLALSIAGRWCAMRIVICAAILSGACAVLISGLTPAISNYVHLGLTPDDLPNLHPAAAYLHQADFIGLRDGSLRLIDIATLQGIITFPSYHAALGTIFIWGFTRLGPVGWTGAGWAGLMLLATPVDGAHYFVDVFAGIALAAAAMALAHILVSRPWISSIARALRRPAAMPSALPA
jgi:hypothetical protein